MMFHNSTNAEVLICMNGKEIALKPDANININCLGSVAVELKHSYCSTAMPVEQIALDNLDASVVSLVTSSYKEPYFNLVLDCKYQISGSQETRVCIQKETIRPVYPCSYDRLYPVVSDGIVDDIAYTFPERQSFENHYLKVISGNNMKIVTILVIVLSILSLPITLICFFANLLIGIVATILIAVVLSLVYIVGKIISKLLSKAECSFVFSEFKSDRIIKHFNSHAC